MRALVAGEGIAVALDVLAERKAERVPAIPAFAAENVGTHDDAVADPEFLPCIFERAAGRLADLGDLAHDLVPGNDRKGRMGFRRRSRILHRLAAERVLVGPAEAAHFELDDHRDVIDIRIGIAPDFELSRRRHHRGADAVLLHGDPGKFACSRASVGVRRLPSKTMTRHAAPFTQPVEAFVDLLNFRRWVKELADRRPVGRMIANGLRGRNASA